MSVSFPVSSFFGWINPVCQEETMYQPQYQQVPNNNNNINGDPYGGFNAGGNGGGEQLSFQQFDYQQPASSNPYGGGVNSGSTPAAAGGGGYGFNGADAGVGGGPSRRHDLPNGVTWASIKRAFSTGGFDDEPPLLEGMLLDLFAACLEPTRQLSLPSQHSHHLFAHQPLFIYRIGHQLSAYNLKISNSFESIQDY